MKLSIITPTHSTEHLSELQESIFANTHHDWEWIILTNNGAEYVSNDPRIRVIKSTQETTFVGALKKEACSYATGEIIVEVDHDDMITPDCLQEIEIAFQDYSIGFAYSDNAKLADNFIAYDSSYGWSKHSPFEWKGQQLISMNSQRLTPGRLGFIWYAPDHVRAWRKSIYDHIGGHNEKMEVIDDLDLMHRLYMVTKFHYIPKTLYIYRITGENTWLKRNELVQTLNMEVFFRDIEALSMRWADMNSLLKIDLCGGFNKPEGYVSIDMEGADLVTDLNNGIPLPDNSCGIVRAYDAMEHLVDKHKTMKEIHRVLAPGGMLISMTPSTDGRGAWQDPTHVSFWNENSFWYYTRPQQMQYIRNTDVAFYESVLRTFFPSDWHRENNISYVQAILEKK